MTNNNKEQKSQDNKALFGPLGKYAIVAIIMVSVIVTTAIMLDKQLNRVEQEIATLEQEVTDINNTETASNEVVDTLPAETINSQSSEDKVEKPIALEPETQASTTKMVATENSETDSMKAVSDLTEIKEDDSEDDFSEVITNAAKTNAATQTMDNEARIAANKQKQKQRLSDQFARINKRELEQLKQYKANQDKRIERLRKQNKQQEKIIDALIVRNQELATIREVNIQRNQSNRAEILNRI